MNFKRIFFASLCLIIAATAAAITSGSYLIKSHSGKYLTENASTHALICTDRISGSYSQVWTLAVNGSDVTIANALTGRFVQKTTGNSWSESYVTGSSVNTFVLKELTGDDALKLTFTDKWDGGLHQDASLNVVLWQTSAEASEWTVENVTIDQKELLRQQQAAATATNEQLTQFFTTTACTTLKDTYAGSSDADLHAAISGLPATVQNLIVKVKKDGWTTYGGWDKTERTFRIADYKAYSNFRRWTSILGLSYDLSYLENPTGIYVDAGSYIQVYVGDIPEGQSVQLAVAGYGAGDADGSPVVTYELHEGMNALLMTTSGNCFVVYEVDNTTDGAAPFTPLATYPDVTVHIEGGTVQGYFDLTRGDDNDDWQQFKAHLMSREMFCMKTRTLVFNLQTELIKAAVDDAGRRTSKGELVQMLQYWQSVQDMEDDLFARARLGGPDGEYCNNVHAVTTTGQSGDGALFAYTGGIFFSPEQHNRLFNNRLIREGSDNLWASAHELGHHRQSQINMVGNTEMSNNIFSNVAVFQQGRYTSRTANVQNVLRDYMDGLSWPERVCRANGGRTSDAYNQQVLHLNWSLYLYFHVLGKQPTFFQDLFTALRADPMTSVAGDSTLTPASTDYLKYYVKCCQASGYDLTDFFAAYGFFILPPEQEQSITAAGVTTNRYQRINDYATYNLYVTRDMIDAAKAQVAAMKGLKSGTPLIFIEDRVKAPLATYDGHAEGELKRSNDVSASIGSVGETGQYTDFDAPLTPYRYNVSRRGNVTMSGTGAVGFVVRNSSGDIIGLYNTYTFRLPKDADGYTIEAVGGNGDVAVSTIDTSIKVKEFPSTATDYLLCLLIVAAAIGAAVVLTKTLRPRQRAAR